MRAVFLSMVLASTVAAQEPKAIDLYGTESVSRRELLEKFGVQISSFFRLYCADQPSAMPLKAAIESDIRSMGPFAYAGISVIDYDLTHRGASSYLTIDIVEEGDRLRRMPFGRLPKAELSDPDGLLAAWKAYESKARGLLASGSVDPRHIDCGAAFHCLAGFSHPDLAPYAAIFSTGAAKNKDALAEILRRGKEPGARAAAAFLLAHISDGAELVRILTPAIRDPDPLVRNNVLRVLAHTAMGHPEVPMPLDPVLEALQFPETTDRNKALAILLCLADRPRYKDTIAVTAGRALLGLLRLSQPDNHDLAYAVLRKASGKDYPDTDYDSWQSWLRRRTRW
jgi:hypothetical protein